LNYQEKTTHCPHQKNAPPASADTTSHSFTVLSSSDPDAIFEQSGENDTLLTEEECPRNVPTNSKRDFSKLPALISFLKAKASSFP
jgi:hypothetical protein